MKPIFTKWMITNWIGSDHLNTQELLDLMVELLNGSYTIEELRADVIDLCTDEEAL